MIRVYVPYVGDGLAAGICTINGTRIQIDCGSMQNAELAFYGGLVRIYPEVFFLSHFHADHYNGLLYAINSKQHYRFRIRQVFFPRIPQFRDRRKFVLYMLAMNHYILGDTTGSMAADFLRVLSRINRNSFKYKALSAGELVTVGGAQYEVLWPPAEIDGDSTRKVISRAIDDFENALEEDEGLRRIVGVVEEGKEIGQYTSTELESGVIPGDMDKYDRLDNMPPLRERRNIPESVREANRSLRKAANHLSLAFHEDNKLLFLGDLESYDIRRVVELLGSKGRNRFFVTITAHHGTHRDKSLHRIRTCYAVSSVGRRLFQHLSPDYGRISNIHLNTYLNGDIKVHPCSPPWYSHRAWLCSSTFPGFQSAECLW